MSRQNLPSSFRVVGGASIGEGLTNFIDTRILTPLPAGKTPLDRELYTPLSPQQEMQQPEHHREPLRLISSLFGSRPWVTFPGKISPSCPSPIAFPEAFHQPPGVPRIGVCFLRCPGTIGKKGILLWLLYFKGEPFPSQKPEKQGHRRATESQSKPGIKMVYSHVKN